MKKVLKIIFSTIGWAILAFLCTLIVWNLVDKLTAYRCPPFGNRITSIGSSSMEIIYPGRDDLPDYTTRIKKGDVIRTNQVKSYDDLNKYDVITYYNGQVLVCHRIVDLYESDGVKYIVTQGDANNIPDQPFAFELVRGRVVEVLPTALGDFIIFMTSGYGVMAVCFSGAFICLGLFVYHNVTKKERATENATPNGETPNNLDNKPLENVDKYIENKEVVKPKSKKKSKSTSKTTKKSNTNKKKSSSNKKTKKNEK